MNVSRSEFCRGASAAALAALAQPAAADPSPEIVVGAATNESAGTALYAQDLGMYKKAGLNVKLTVLTNPAPMLAAVAAGTVAVSGIPLSQAAVARQKGIPIVMIAPGALYLSSVLTNALIVLKDSPYTQASDLNGKTIATRDVANMSYLGARAWLDKNGGDSKTVRWLEITDTQDVAAMQAGRVDAATVGEPGFDEALRSGQVRVLGRCFDAIAPRFMIAGFFTSEGFAKANPDLAARVGAVITEAARWANQKKNQPESAQILARYTLSPVQPDAKRVVYAEDSRASDIQPVLDVLLAYGFLKAPMRANELVSPLLRLT